MADEERKEYFMVNIAVFKKKKTRVESYCNKRQDRLTSTVFVAMEFMLTF